MSIELEFEDKMDRAEIFVSGIDGRHVQREWYNTIMDFDKMLKFLEEQKDNYTTQQWNRLYEHFNFLSYLSPMNALVASQIKRCILLI